MRTTLDIDDDVLLAAKEMAAKEKTTAGKVLSTVFRRALSGAANEAANPTRATKPRLKNGIPVVPSRGELITTGHVEHLMDEEGV